MTATVNVANVMLWGQRVGAVALDEHGIAAFEYDPDFIRQGFDIAPITMPLSHAAPGTVYSFPALNRETFHTLPGLLADSLPDKYGRAVIDAWLARQGRPPEDFSVIERLCYTGSRAMGALEYQPNLATAGMDNVVDIELEQMVQLVREVINRRDQLHATLSDDDKQNERALLHILAVGTSAGGARAKAVIAFNETTGEVKSGQSDAPPGFSHWLLKFDGTGDIELGETQGYGRIEYAYSLMARAAGITMMPCRLLEEHGRAHFMTQRFDRVGNEKLHMQSLCALAHYDFNLPGAYSYEQALMIMRRMKLPKSEQLELYRRMVFNVMARNLDDHTKNIAFLMDQQGQWRLSPAFDVTYAHNPKGQWTNAHQMSINGKRHEIALSDLQAVAENADLTRADKVIQDVQDAVKNWRDFAKEAVVPEVIAEQIGAMLLPI